MAEKFSGTRDDSPSLCCESYRKIESYRSVIERHERDDGPSNDEDGPRSKDDGGRDDAYEGDESSLHGRICSFYRSVPDKPLTDYERKTITALHRRDNRRFNEPWRKFEWGDKPRGFREWRDYHYIFWRRTYIDYIVIIYERFMKKLKTFKGFSNKKISLEQFIDFSYVNSSGYITKYA